MKAFRIFLLILIIIGIGLIITQSLWVPSLVNKIVGPTALPVLPSSASLQASTATSTNLTEAIPSDWKTYVNSEWGITVRYPPNWQPQGGAEAGDSGIPDQAFGLIDSSSSIFTLSFDNDISIATNTPPGSPPLPPGFSLPTTVSVTLNGYPAEFSTSSIMTPFGNAVTETYTISWQNSNFEFQFPEIFSNVNSGGSVQPIDNSQYEPIFKEIVQSIKFVQPTSTPATSASHLPSSYVYFQLPDQNLQFLVSPQFKSDLIYQEDPKYGVTDFSSKSLMALDQDCNDVPTYDNALGGIEVAQGNPQWDIIPTAEYRAGNLVITYSVPQDQCGMNPRNSQVENLESTQIAELEKDLSSITTIK